MCSLAQPCPTLCNPTDCSSPGSPFHGIFSDKNPEMGCHFLLQRIFLTQGSNSHLFYILHWQLSSFFFLAGEFFNTAPPVKPTDLILYTLYSFYCRKLYCVLAYKVHTIHTICYVCIVYILYIVYAA